MAHGTSKPAFPLLFALLLTVGCGSQVSGGSDEEATGSGARRTEAPRVIVAKVERREMVRYLETTTKIESEREISIHPETSGIVLSVHAEEGDEVAADDVLCILDSRDQELGKRDAEVGLREAQDGLKQPGLDRADATSRLESTLASWEQAVRDYERDQDLFEDTEVASAVSQQALEASQLAVETTKSAHDQAKIALDKVELAADQAATAVSRAEVALSRAEFALDQRTIIARFAGTVAERSVRVGQSVGPADAVYILTDLKNIRAVFNRAQEELALFRPGHANGEGSGSSALTFRATTEALPNSVYTGRVQRVSPTINRESGQFRVTAIFDEPTDGPQEALLPGMLVRLRIATDRHPDALVLPKRAVRREGDVAYVLRIDESDEVTRIIVREGYDDEDLVEVLPSEPGLLSVGDRVVAVGSRDLEDGDRVSVDKATIDPSADPTAEPATEE